MDQKDILVATVAVIFITALVWFIIWQNSKDRSVLKPDKDAVEEMHHDKERKRNNS